VVLSTVRGKYGRRKEVERFGKELEVGLFSEYILFATCEI